MSPSWGTAGTQGAEGAGEGREEPSEMNYPDLSQDALGLIYHLNLCSLVKLKRIRRDVEASTQTVPHGSRDI